MLRYLNDRSYGRFSRCNKFYFLKHFLSNSNTKIPIADNTHFDNSKHISVQPQHVFVKSQKAFVLFSLGFYSMLGPCTKRGNTPSSSRRYRFPNYTCCQKTDCSAARRRVNVPAIFADRRLTQLHHTCKCNFSLKNPICFIPNSKT